MKKMKMSDKVEYVYLLTQMFSVLGVYRKKKDALAERRKMMKKKGFSAGFRSLDVSTKVRVK